MLQFVSTAYLFAHKSVVCIQSEYFEKLFQEGFNEGSLWVLIFNEGIVVAYWRVFEYLYTVDYSDDLSKDFEGERATIIETPNDLTATRRPPAADRPTRIRARRHVFLFKDLKELSTNKLCLNLKTLWTSELFPDLFLECIREVYASTLPCDGGMRSAVAKVASSNSYLLTKKAVFEELISQGGDFDINFMQLVIK